MRDYYRVEDYHPVATAGTALHSKHYQVVHGCVCACFRVVACSKKVVISLNVAGSVSLSGLLVEKRGCLFTIHTGLLTAEISLAVGGHFSERVEWSFRRC